MNLTITDLSPHALRIEIQTPWESVAPDYNDAAENYRHANLPGFRPGRAPLHLIARHFQRDIATAATRRAAERLTRDALREKSIKTVGAITITAANLQPNQPFTCTVELTKRPQLALPDYKTLRPAATDTDARHDEISDYLLANTPCTPPDALIRQNLPPGNSTAQPGSTAWTEATQAAQLILITHQIADTDGITIDEEKFSAHIAEIAALNGTSPQHALNTLAANGNLTPLRDFFLTETVLEYLSSNNSTPPA